MGRPAENIVGKKFGRLLVISNTEAGKSMCVCDCGGMCEKRNAHLKSGRSKSCGCLRKECRRTHGMRKSPEYRCYYLAKRRCNNPKDKRYHNYGGRGIRFLFESFEEFYQDVGERPSQKHSIDRIDNNGHYQKGNIRWAEIYQQSRNRTSNVFLDYLGESLCIEDWARRLKVSPGTIRYRIRAGKTIDEVLSPT